MGNTEFQKEITGSFTAAAQTVDLTSPNSGTTTIQLSGTWVGTLVLEGSNDQSTYFSLLSLDTTNDLYISEFTANGSYLGITNGYQYLRIRSSAWTSGTANVSVYGSDQPSVVYTKSFLDSGQLVPTITNQFRVRLNNVNTNIGTSYVTLFTRSGTGLFFGFQADFNNADITMKLIIDGGTVFELLLNDIRDFQFNDTTTTRTQMGGFLTTIGNTLDFSSKFAIPYDTDITVQANTSSGTKINTRWIVFLTEDS